MDMNAFVSATEAAQIIEHFNPYRNWTWFLALNRFGKTSDCPVVPFRFDSGSVTYRIADLVDLLKTYVVPLTAEHDICAAIDGAVRKLDHELDDLLAELGGENELSSEIAEVGKTEPSFFLESDCDLSVCMDEAFLLGFFEEMNSIRNDQVVCAENLTVLAGAIEVLKVDGGSESNPLPEETIAFCRRLITDAYGCADRVNELNNMLYQMASTVFVPDELLAERTDSAEGIETRTDACSKASCHAHAGEGV